MYGAKRAKRVFPWPRNEHTSNTESDFCTAEAQAGFKQDIA